MTAYALRWGIDVHVVGERGDVGRGETKTRHDEDGRGRIHSPIDLLEDWKWGGATSPVASVGASFGNQDAELLKVIKHEVVVDLQGAAGLPRTARAD